MIHNLMEVIVRTDSLNEYFSNISEFTSVASHLHTEVFSEFEVWFEKLYKKDKRALFFYIKDNRDKLSDDKIKFAEKVFNKKIV